VLIHSHIYRTRIFDNGIQKLFNGIQIFVGGTNRTTSHLSLSLRALSVKMGVTKDVITPGDGRTFPQTGDQLTMHYQYVDPNVACRSCVCCCPAAPLRVLHLAGSDGVVIRWCAHSLTLLHCVHRMNTIIQRDIGVDGRKV
jgi:hypothetical protein